jgi:FtsH-binding integral membrane protein
LGSTLRRVSLALLGVVAFVIISIALEDEIGLPFNTTYRVVCAAMCLVFIFKLGLDYRGERWPRASFWVALLVNVGLFFTPLVNRPASRGELMLFALPDAIVVLAARIASYPVADEHQRAMRQQMILGLIVAVAFCATLFALMLMEPHTAH